jgi:hypothetical protein
MPPRDAGPFTCVGDGDCGIRLRCLAGACTECVNDGDCTPKHCDLALRRCVDCTSVSQCPPGNAEHPSTCTSDTRRCIIGCDDSGPLCPTGGPRPFTCDDSGHICFECTTNAQCAGSLNGSLCHPTDLVCVQCITTCPNGLICDAVTGHCVGCRTSADCPTAAAPICSPAGYTCVAPPGP